PEPEPEPPKVTRVASPPIVKPKPAEKTQAKSFVSENLATLEAQKKKLLQRMLAQQAVTEVQPKVEQKVEQEVKVEPKITEEVKVAPAEVEAPPVIEALVEAEVAPVVVVNTDVETNIAEESTTTENFLTWGDNGRPRWAENNFEVLLFEVAGLSLAVPLVALGQIVPLDKKLTFLQGQSDWFMGILPSSIGDIRTINTALFVMPERNNADFADNAKYVVTIDGFAWGLAVDNVKQPISLAPDDVKWRTERSKRPWLAGTVKSHMCALIDIPQMAELLEGSDHNRPH
ncbi:MAG: chemotaxis protein CheW, partial [Agarilytica sp.]